MRSVLQRRASSALQRNCGDSAPLLLRCSATVVIRPLFFCASAHLVIRARSALQRDCAAMAFDSKFTDTIISEVGQILENAGISGQRVAAADRVLAILTNAGLCFKQKIAPEYVGVHPDNRSGHMISAMEAHRHGYEVTQAGWSDRKCADATATLPPPDPAFAIAKNKSLVECSNGYLPPWKGSMPFQSGHRTQTPSFAQ